MSERSAIYGNERHFTDGQCSVSYERVGDQGDFDLVIAYEGGVTVRLPMTRERANALALLLTHAATPGNVRPIR